MTFKDSKKMCELEECSCRNGVNGIICKTCNICYGMHYGERCPNKKYQRFGECIRKWKNPRKKKVKK